MVGGASVQARGHVASAGHGRRSAGLAHVTVQAAYLWRQQSADGFVERQSKFAFESDAWRSCKGHCRMPNHDGLEVLIGVYRLDD